MNSGKKEHSAQIYVIHSQKLQQRRVAKYYNDADLKEGWRGLVLEARGLLGGLFVFFCVIVYILTLVGKRVRFLDLFHPVVIRCGRR